MINILKNVNKIAMSVISNSYNVQRFTDTSINKYGEVSVNETKQFSVIGSFQPYDPNIHSNSIDKTEFGDVTKNIKVFYVTDGKSSLRINDAIQYNGENWIILGPVDFVEYGGLAYICMLGGANAEQNYNGI